MKSCILTTITYLSLLTARAQELKPTHFEKTLGLETSTYQDGIAYYQYLDSLFEDAQLLETGPTDSGYPLHLFLISKQSKDDRKKPFVLIMNGIHPGESDGIDASMMLARDLLTTKTFKKFLDSVEVGIIPFYNIGGALNRNCCTRANQNGPKAYGFRGNALNYDLNRDFIKADTRNTRTFQAIFNRYKPCLFLDTHVSNGADYPYTLTYIESQPDKLGRVLGQYQTEVISTFIINGLEKQGVLCSSYIDFDVVPEKGITSFFDAARYSTGYASLFNCPGYMIETHMLKPYKERVNATFIFLKEAINFVYNNGQELSIKISNQQQVDQNEQERPIQWKLNEIRVDSINFKGYTARYKTSRVSGMQQIYYDRSAPYQKFVPYYRFYKPTEQVIKPFAYHIPHAYRHVVELMVNAGVQVDTVGKDTVVSMQQYRIINYETSRRPYEGHYPHDQTKVESYTVKKVLAKGDFIIRSSQPAYRFIMECLEPAAKDSYFNWNYFDAILQSKEGFSDYVFEPVAEELLQKDLSLKKAFEEKKNSDPDFANQHYAQLLYIYRRSEYAEPGYMIYPISRILQPIKIK